MLRSLLGLLDPEGRRRLRMLIAEATLAAVLQGAAFALAVPVLTRLLGPHPSGAWPWLAAVVAATAGHVAVSYHNECAVYVFGARAGRTLHHRIGEHVARLPLGWFSGDRVGRLSRLSTRGVQEVATTIGHTVTPLISACTTPLTVVVVTFGYDWRLALAMLAALPLVAAAYRWASRRGAALDRLIDASSVESSDRLVEFARAQPVLRAFGRTDQGYRALDAALEEAAAASRAGVRLGLPAIMAVAMAVQAGFVLVLMLGTALALGGSLGAAETLALMVLAVRFVEPMSTAGVLAATLRIARGSVDRMSELLHTRPLPQPAPALSAGRAAAAPAGEGRTPAAGSPSPGEHSAAIELDGVCFGYEPEQPVLNDISFTVPAGATVALVGPSGSGKTTVIRLIARFWDTGSGTVRVGGDDVRDLATEELMARISPVFQDVYLFEGSLEENIRMGRPEASTAEVRRAAEQARVTEIAHRLPGGWSGRVGEGGATLSGGERQRVSIARAILKNAPMVLLDEATSSLDPENEAAVQDALHALTGNRTVLVIAHRMQTVVNADRILVLDGGRIAEEGTHAELLRLGGRYAAFWRERTRVRGWKLVAD